METSLTIRQYCLLYTRSCQEQINLLNRLKELEINDLLVEPFLNKFNLKNIQSLVIFIMDKINGAAINLWKLKDYPKYLARVIGSDLEIICDSLNITDQQIFSGRTEALNILTNYIQNINQKEPTMTR